MILASVLASTTEEKTTTEVGDPWAWTSYHPSRGLMSLAFLISDTLAVAWSTSLGDGSMKTGLTLTSRACAKSSRRPR